VEVHATAGSGSLRKKSRLQTKFARNTSQGLKPPIHFATFAARINSCPDTRLLRIEFFRKLWRPALRLGFAGFICTCGESQVGLVDYGDEPRL
jgi:hypothetical protein